MIENCKLTEKNHSFKMYNTLMPHTSYLSDKLIGKMFFEEKEEIRLESTFSDSNQPHPIIHLIFLTQYFIIKSQLK